MLASMVGSPYAALQLSNQRSLSVVTVSPQVTMHRVRIDPVDNLCSLVRADACVHAAIPCTGSACYAYDSSSQCW